MKDGRRIFDLALAQHEAANDSEEHLSLPSLARRARECGAPIFADQVYELTCSPLWPYGSRGDEWRVDRCREFLALPFPLTWIEWRQPGGCSAVVSEIVDDVLSAWVFLRLDRDANPVIYAIGGVRSGIHNHRLDETYVVNYQLEEDTPFIGQAVDLAVASLHLTQIKLRRGGYIAPLIPRSGIPVLRDRMLLRRRGVEAERHDHNVVDIRPFRALAARHPDAEHNSLDGPDGLCRALHLVRGHIKVYRAPGPGLFGKHYGAFYCPPHWRGDAHLGTQWRDSYKFGMNG